MIAVEYLDPFFLNLVKPEHGLFSKYNHHFFFSSCTLDDFHRIIISSLSLLQSHSFLPPLVLPKQGSAVGAVVLSHIEGRAAERDQAAGPTTKK